MRIVAKSPETLENTGRSGIIKVGNDIYMSDESGELTIVVTSGEENMLPADDSHKIIATAPSDHNFIYIA